MFLAIKVVCSQKTTRSVVLVVAVSTAAMVVVEAVTVADLAYYFTRKAKGVANSIV